MATSEQAFIMKALSEGLRVDGRRTHELRPISIAFGTDGAKGSVQVRLGETKVLAVATADLVEPYPDRPTEGVLQFFVELSAMASPAFEPGRPSEAAIELMRLLGVPCAEPGAGHRMSAWWRGDTCGPFASTSRFSTTAVIYPTQ